MTNYSTAPVRLPVPEVGRGQAEHYVAQHFDGLFAEDSVVSSHAFRGGQSSAERALRGFDVSGYAKYRNEAYPASRRGASGLSPYIRHGLVTLRQAWAAVNGGPPTDVRKFRDELLWQEYARHWYARLGHATSKPLRTAYPERSPSLSSYWESEPGLGPGFEAGWDVDMACMELTIGELEDDGWLVNQTRMWLASHWTVRQGLPWRAGEDLFFRHLLDGSRAANRLGWQWTTGVGSNRAYGFSRWQVEKRAPGLCASCEVAPQCPIDSWPDEVVGTKVAPEPLIAADPDPEFRVGPSEVQRHGEADAVWLTAESLGFDDPALAANPDLVALFVFDRPLLRHLQLSSKRLVFLTETLAELALHRPVEIHLGDPAAALADRRLATTFAPVPGWRRRSDQLTMVELHPWPWLRQPVPGTVGSFSAWSRQVIAAAPPSRSS